MTLSADYSTQPNYAQRPDFGQRGLVITCKTLDPSLRPWSALLNPLEFTLPRETLEKYHQRPLTPPKRPKVPPRRGGA